MSLLYVVVVDSGGVGAAAPASLVTAVSVRHASSTAEIILHRCMNIDTPIKISDHI